MEEVTLGKLVQTGSVRMLQQLFGVPPKSQDSADQGQHQVHEQDQEQEQASAPAESSQPAETETSAAASQAPSVFSVMSGALLEGAIASIARTSPQPLVGALGVSLRGLGLSIQGKSAREDFELRVEHLRGDIKTCSHILVHIDGFMTENFDCREDWSSWEVPNHVALFRLQWEAGCTAEWLEFVSNVVRKRATMGNFEASPWGKAKGMADAAGMFLAQELLTNSQFRQGRQIHLIGHSLGGAVLMSTLLELARQRRHNDPPIISNAIFLAGAVNPTDAELFSAANEVADDGKLLNVYSPSDQILGVPFQVSESRSAMGSAAIDFTQIGVRNAANVDVSDLVALTLPSLFGHGYGRHMDVIRTRLLPFLPALQAPTSQ